MGKVLDKLQAMAAVKSLVQGSNGIVILLNDTYKREDGATETVVQTAHAARLWIQEASNGRDAPRKARKVVQIATEDGEFIEQEIEDTVVRYPGIAKEDCKPIWELPKGWNPNDAEGRDAFRRGYARNSHPFGDLATAGKEFEAAWDQEKRKADVAAAALAAAQVELDKAA